MNVEESRTDERLARLEDFAEETKERLTRIEVRLDGMATREDLHRELHALTWRMIGAMTILCGAVFWIARNVAPPAAAAPVAVKAPLK